MPPASGSRRRRRSRFVGVAIRPRAGTPAYNSGPTPRKNATRGGEPGGMEFAPSRLSLRERLRGRRLHWPRWPPIAASARHEQIAPNMTVSIDATTKPSVSAPGRYHRDHFDTRRSAFEKYKQMIVNVIFVTRIGQNDIEPFANR